MNRIFSYIIFIHVVFLMGCSDNIVYNKEPGTASSTGIDSMSSLRKGSPGDRNINGRSMAEVEGLIFVGINKIRTGKNLHTLRRDSDLDSVARNYSKAMANAGSISHVDSKGDRLEDRLEMNGIADWSQAGENLASSSVGADPAQSALWGWQQSSGHIENILLPTYVYTGIGAYQNPKSGEVFITQLFMTP